MGRNAHRKKRKKSRFFGEPEKRRGSCPYCANKVGKVDWKQHEAIRSIMAEKGKIRSRRVTRLCRYHQGQVAVAIKRGREAALLPYLSQ